jgi:hypothetical protein
MVIDQVEIAVGQDQLHVDLGPLDQKVDDDRENMQPAEDDRRGDEKVAPGRGIGAGRCALGFANFLKDAFAGGDIGCAGVGENESARRAGQEPRLEAGFELGNLAADCRKRHAEFAAGG